MIRTPFSRRTALGLGAATSSLALLSACSTSTGGGATGEGTTLWYWPEGFARILRGGSAATRLRRAE